MVTAVSPLKLGSHCLHKRSDTPSDFACSLTVTDIATGWTEVRTVRNKAARHVFCALVEIQAALPFPLLGIDSDNGSEFINEHLLQWCTDQQITFTRSRPANKNDGCHVEQKNWDIARRTVGYWRYDTPGEIEMLNRIWPPLSPLINLFTPQQKLRTKTRVGAKVTKTYDRAQTPYHGCWAIPTPSTTPTPAASPPCCIPPTRPPPAATSPTSAPPCSNGSNARPSPPAPRTTASTYPKPRSTTAREAGNFR